VSSLSGVWVDSVANFGFLSKTMNKKTPLNADIGRERLILVCYIRTYVIILAGIFPLTSPQPKYWRGCVPGIPGGVDASEMQSRVDYPSSCWFPAKFSRNRGAFYSTQRTCIRKHNAQEIMSDMQISYTSYLHSSCVV